MNLTFKNYNVLHNFSLNYLKNINKQATYDLFLLTKGILYAHLMFYKCKAIMYKCCSLRNS